MKYLVILVTVMAWMSVLSPASARAVELPTVGCNWDVVTWGIEQYCINVYGAGLFVDRFSGELEKVAKAPSPMEGAEVNAYGTLESGRPFNATVVAPVSTASSWSPLVARKKSPVLGV